MATVGSPAGAPPHAHNAAEPRRRKVRKGTQSCWACKRRKIRCSFREPTDTVCDGCRSRGTACVSQELPETPLPPTPGRKVEVRLGRMEEVVNQLVKHVDDIGVAHNVLETPPRVSYPATSEPESSTSHSTSLEGRSSSSASFATLDTGVVFRGVPSEKNSCRVKEHGGEYDALSRELLGAWPCSHDLDLIIGSSIDTSIIYHGLICTPYSSFSSRDALSLREILIPPLPSSPPVLIARKLLILGTLLQGVPRPTPSSLSSLSIGHRDIMSRAVESASRLVTSNDELVDCVEGIECVMIESMFHNNLGNLRRSWLAMRRAIIMAQMIGLHREASWSSVKILEPQTQTRVSLSHLWYRLIQSDRYLSMMLGLPPGVLEDDFADSSLLEHCMPMERMERLQSVAGGRILQREGTEGPDLAQLYDTDRLLQSAAALMPAQWWLIPKITPVSGDTRETLWESIRMMNQLAHYNILVHLHLPYMLWTSADGRYDYSKMTAVNASRELLARFVSFRNDSPVTAYCRGIDFLAFTASTVLCLAHIEAKRQQHGHATGHGGVFSFMVHQRLSDRGMMERALHCLEFMADGGSDVLAFEIAGILRHLLIIEQDAANGSTYEASSTSEMGEGELGCRGQVYDGGNALHLSIPYFGTIKIERNGVSKSNFTGPTRSFAEPNAPVSSQPQNGNDANFRAGYRLGIEPLNPDWQVVPSHYDHPTHQHGDDLVGCGNDGPQDIQLLVPGLAANVNDWALQGVEMTLFDTLLSGTEMDLTEDASWTV